MTEFKTPEPSTTTKRIFKDSKSPLKMMIPPSPGMKQLGYGTGVNVYLMERFSPMQGCYKSPWAVKKINRMVQFPEFAKRLTFEADILKRLNHPNIIGYRSYVSGKDGLPCLMMESGEKSLLDIIELQESEGLGPLPPQHILKVTSDVAAALQYLHDEKKLLHGDLKSANVLIKGDFTVAKLCDFGVALKLNEKGEACQDEEYIGTECWSAPEVLIGGKVSQKTDMFAFGLLIWEMIALCAPHIDKLNFNERSEEMNSSEDIEAWEAMQAECDLEYQNSLGTRPPLPNVELGDDYLPVLEIFYACTETDPSLRPSAQQVVHVLQCLRDIQAAVKEKHEAQVKEKVDK